MRNSARKYITILALFAAGVSRLFAGESGWLTDFEQAKAEAAKKNLPILADFAGSDWCGWCIRLDREVFSKDAFKEYAKDNVVLFLADFPRGKPQSEAVKTQNKALAGKYGIQGFPTVLLLDSKGNIIGRTGYRKGGPAAYVEHLKALRKQGKGSSE